MVFCSNCKWRPVPPDVKAAGNDWETNCSRGHLVLFADLSPRTQRPKLRLIRNASICLDRDITEHRTRFERILDDDETL